MRKENTTDNPHLSVLGDYAIESVEIKSGSELSGEARIGIMIENERFVMLVPLKEGKKEGAGMILRKNGTLFMKLMFVKDVCEGEVIKKNKYGRTVLRGRMQKGKKSECG